MTTELNPPFHPPLIGRLKSHWAANGMIRNRASITPGRRNSDTNTATTHALRIFKVIQRLSLNDYRSDILDRHQSEIGVPSDDVRHPRSRCIRYRVIERAPNQKCKTCRRLKLALFFFFFKHHLIRRHFVNDSAY